uniref:Chromosome 1 open reading frame 127 n=1 Tax=Chlorocebus sabaeus TaxID=60711 RepID=A0A0D9S8N3_CHLSB
ISPHPSLLSHRAVYLACVQPTVFPWSLSFRSDRDKPSSAPEVLTEEASSCWTDTVECFSDYMTLWIPRSHVEGLRLWLARTLHLPGAWRAPNHLDSSFAKCGYFLHPASDGDFFFQVQYSACFVQKEKANYKLEIRIFQKGVTRLERSDRYIMKCPMLRSRLGQESVHCGPMFIQVSRPLPLRSDNRQTPWLLSLRGELVASLEDASLMGLYVDISATTVTVQSPRQGLLQRWEVLNTSAELLPLWLVSGHHAYSLEAACPPVSFQPESEVFVHIPKQRLGLVKRGSYIEETLSLRFLRVQQSNIFMVTENKDFVVVSIPAAGVLQVQRCQEVGGTLGTQAFYRVDLSLQFAEMAAPVLWTVESFFQCVGSGTELPASTATPRAAPSPPSPGPETPPARVPSAASSQVWAAGPAAQEWLSWDLLHQPSDALAKKGLGPLLQTAKLARRGQTSASIFPRVMQAQRGLQAPPGEVGFPGHPTPPVTLPSEPVEGVQASPWRPHPVLPVHPTLTLPVSSDASSPPLPALRPGQSESLLVSGPSVTLTEGLGTVRPEQDPAQSPGSPLLLRGLSRGDMAAPEPISGEPGQASEELQPLMRPWRARLAAEALVSHHSPRESQETSSGIEVERLRQAGPGFPREGARGLVDFSSSEPSEDMEGPGLSTLLGRDATFSTPSVRQPDPSACAGASGPELTGTPRVRPAAPLAVLPMEPLPAELVRPAALLTPKTSSAGGSDQALYLECTPGSAGQEESGAAHASSPLSTQTLSPWAPTGQSLPSLVELEHPFLAGRGASPQQELTGPTLAPSAESHRPPELQDSVEGLPERSHA